MKKNNNKGFMLLETLVVSAFIITVLIYLYVQFVNLKSSYDTSFRYDTIPNLYSLKQVDTFINKAYGYDTFKAELKKSENNNYLELYKNKCELEYFSDNNSYCNKLMEELNIKTLIMVNNRLDSVKNRFKEHNPYSNGFLKYLKSIDPILASKSYLLIAEFNDKTYGYIKLDDVNVVVTFDANGGSVKTRTKNVTPGNTYGELPTPTREGYTFKGWNGKNLTKDLVSNNYTVYHYNDRTSHEFKNDNNKQFIHIIGNSSTSNIDTSWYFKNNSYINLKKTTYSLGFDVRSKNCVTNQTFIRRTNTASGKTGLYLNTYQNFNNLRDDDLITTISNDLTFNNDGDWHRINSTLIVSTNVDSGILVIGYDTPNSYGTNCYIDISNIQLEEGEEATEYEPYYVTKDTKVVQSDNHTLKAIWEANN